jgi:hypothetical protein
MSKRVFFSFHYEDVASFRANVVRRHDVTKESNESGFFDSSIWEDAKLVGGSAIKRLINTSLENTSVTCVLIGSDTWNRPWVRYEILKSYDRGNKLLGIHINSIKDKYQRTYLQGKNPFSYLGFYIPTDGRVTNYQEVKNGNWKTYSELQPSLGIIPEQYRRKGIMLSEFVPIYDWIANGGYYNFKTWIDNA